MNLTQERVLVIDGNTLISSHTINLLIEKDYLIRLTYPHEEFFSFQTFFPSKNKIDIETIKADIDLPSEAWDSIISNCDFVIFALFPFFKKPLPQGEELIKLTLNRTKEIINACIRQKVKKIVVNSNISTIIGGNFTISKFSEDDTCIINENTTYEEKAIYYAEKEMWQIYQENLDKINILCLNISTVIGPIFSSHLSYPYENIVRKALKEEFSGIIRINIPLVDVRDVAQANIKALETETNNVKKIIISAECMWFEEIMIILREEFEKFGYKIPSLKMGYCPMKLISLFDKKLKNILPLIGREFQIDNSKSKTDLKLSYTSLKSGLIESGYSYVKNGMAYNKIYKRKIKSNLHL